jgi:LPXTG-motif cell wall-anchored protein
MREAIVRYPVRKFMGVALVGVLGALFALPMIGAGAQEGGAIPPSPGPCSFTAGGTAPGTVTGTVTVPDGATQVVVTFTPDDTTHPAQTFPQAAPAGGGTVNFTFDVTEPGVVSANYNYLNDNTYVTGCGGPNGEEGIAINRAPTAPTAAAQAAALAFTGSSDTPSYVLIGIAAIVLGAVLVVAAKRRSQVS